MELPVNLLQSALECGVAATRQPDKNIQPQKFYKKIKNKTLLSYNICEYNSKILAANSNNDGQKQKIEQTKL